LIFLRAIGRLPQRRVVGPEVRANRAFGARADAVAPVVTVCVTPARPADDGSLQLAHVINQFLPDAAYVWNLRLFTYPDSVIDNAANMLREMPVKFARNLANRFVDEYFHQPIRGSSRAGSQSDCCKRQG